MKAYIPLSWSHKEIEYPKFYSVNLSLSGIPWVYSAEIPISYNIQELVDKLEDSFGSGFLLRGCKAELSKHMSQKGYEIIRTGAEAVVDLDNLHNLSQSLNELVVRGSKQGRVEEIPLNEVNRQRVSSFIEHTPYALKPHLKYLFINSFDTETRCFVIKKTEDKWLGVVTVSKQGVNYIHTEMILRNKNAPVGVMEFLIVSSMDILKSEGFKHFSLGEVPFITPPTMKKNISEKAFKKSLQKYLLFKSGDILNYAFNYKGLFDFKNKFNPTWEPVYICATPKLPFLSLVDLFYKTGYFKLSCSELLINIKNYPKTHPIS